MVCYCHGVSEREVRRCIRAGARSVTALGRACRAGTGCGGCRPVLDLLLAQEGEAAEAADLPRLQELHGSNAA